MKNIIRFVAIIISLSCPICSMAATEEPYDTLRTLKIPLLTITTVDGAEPQGFPIYPPEGCVGVGLTGNEYVQGRLVITLGDSVLYDSGEYMNNKSGMQIRQRGNTSALWNKKPYKINLAKKADLLFREDEKYRDKDWILLREGLTMNVPVGFKVSELVGQRWTPQYSYVNLIINNDYKGCYILTEAIEVEEGRCNIANTGFIIEDDAYWWNETVSFQGNLLPPQMGYTFKSPAPDDITTPTYNRIKNYISEVESALLNEEQIYDYIDTRSFAAWLLGHDILGTLDAAGSNRYLVKHDYIVGDHTSTLLEMGPLWDFDDSYKREGMWSQQHSGNYKFYYKYLLDDSKFTDEYKDIWYNISSTLYSDMVDFCSNFRDSIGTDIDISRQLDDERWGRVIPTKTVEEDVEFVSAWFGSRVTWINNEIHTVTGVDDIVVEENISKQTTDVYLLNGFLYMNNATPEQLEQLPAGIYIAGGRKLVIK